jgi:DNA-binding transcriptional LysR family regulator
MVGAVMETQHVRYFLAICDELSFTRAAQKCGIKQPTLSEAIKQMEWAIGGKLFVCASPVRPTNLGFRLQPICMRINELLESARAMSTSPEEPTTSRSSRAMSGSGQKSRDLAARRQLSPQERTSSA